MDIRTIPKRNTRGFTLRAGQMLLSESALSAHSGKPLATGGVRLPVPGLERGQFTVTYVVGTDEYRRMTSAQHTKIHEKAREWLATITAAPTETGKTPAPEDPPVTPGAEGTPAKADAGTPPAKKDKGA